MVRTATTESTPLTHPVTPAKAAYDYEAASADEASLREGDLLEVVDTTDPDWWLIARDGRCLLVPATYVELA